MALSEPARLSYLHAMGIQPWLDRARFSAPPRQAAEPAPPALARPPTQPPPRSPAAAAPRPAPAAPQPVAEAPRIPVRGDIARLDWPGLRARVADCRACGLHATRRQSVFGAGDPAADLMIIGEAPGAEEDSQGEPFVGRAGVLLNAMLLAIGLKREQVFIANILKCRPPGNRDPAADEALHCEPFLQRQIELINPRVILAAGRVAAQNLLHTQETLGRLRGKPQRLGARQTPLVITYHPAYLLRSPEQKARAWEDLQQVARLLRG